MATLNKKIQAHSIGVIQGLGMTPPMPSLLELTMKEREIWVFGRFKVETEN